MADNPVLSHARPHDRRAAILEVATETFLERGYAGASMSDIAERLGGSKGTLYNYFRSKEELFRAVVRRRSDGIYAQLQLLPGHPPGFDGYLEAFGTCLLGMILTDDHIAFSRLVIAEAGRIPLAGNFEERRQSVLAPLVERVREEVEAGGIRQVDPLEAAEDFWNLCCATMQRRALMGMVSQPTPAARTAIVRRAIGIFRRAYAPTR